MRLLIYNQFKAIFAFVMGFFPHSTSSCKRDNECTLPLEDCVTNNLFYRLSWVVFHIQPLVVNVTMSVSFLSRFMKQIIYFCVWNEYFFYIQPAVANVTTSVSFPSGIVKQIIDFIVWTVFFDIQPVVTNVTTSVSFPARTMKAMI